MPRKLDITGMRFGRLVAVSPSHRVAGKWSWNFVCDCGKQIKAVGASVKYGQRRSCGCLFAEVAKSVNTKHGMSGTSEHNIWMGMIGRCNNPRNARFKDYGGRGISVCSRWMKFENFISDMGARPKGCSMDRIDNDGPYSPANCRWSNRVSQANNARSNKKITCRGMTMGEAEWARFRGIKRTTVQHRLRVGWSVEEALGYSTRALAEAALSASP